MIRLGWLHGLGLAVLAVGTCVALLVAFEASIQRDKLANAVATRAAAPAPKREEPVPFDRAAALDRLLHADACREALREKMPYLEAYDNDGSELSESSVRGPKIAVDPRGGYVVLLRVKLADSFRASPVGEIECHLNEAGTVDRVSKVAR